VAGVNPFPVNPHPIFDTVPGVACTKVKSKKAVGNEAILNVAIIVPMIYD
jgi:hypothetical protein